MFAFISQYKNLREVLMDQKLAALGDAYVNLVYSLALSKKKGEPTGAKVDNRLLAQALKRVGLRSLLPARIDRHKQADAAEALIAYAWVRGLVTMEEGVNILERGEDMLEAFCSFLRTAMKKIDL
jgi:hypothetical protein